jgi:hypothetical protein
MHLHGSLFRRSKQRHKGFYRCDHCLKFYKGLNVKKTVFHEYIEFSWFYACAVKIVIIMIFVD